MIVKNISPIPITLSGLGRSLMPGEQADLSEYDQKKRDECFELQDAFRKGDMICVGVGVHDRTPPDAQTKVYRAYKHSPNDPQVEIQAVFKPSLDGSEVIHRRYEPEKPEIERVYKYDHQDRPIQHEFEPSSRDIVTVDQHGITTLDPVAFVIPDSTIVPQPYQPNTLPDPKSVEIPSITPEQAQEAMKSRYCIGTRTNGKKCSKRPIIGYDYCSTHMPEDIKQEYYNKKKGEFFKD